MKFLKMFSVFLIAAILDTIIRELGVASSLAALISPSDVDKAAQMAKLISGIISVVLYVLAFFVLRKTDVNRDEKKSL